MTSHTRSIAVIAAVGLMLVPTSMLAADGSASPSAPATTAHPPFEGTRWHLRDFQAEDGGIAGASNGAWITFADRQVTGSTGCNDLAGSYLFDGTIVSIGISSPTEASCLDGDLVGQEMSVLAHLPQVVGIACEDARNADGVNLELVDGFGQRPLVFTSLEHRRWTPIYGGAEPMPEGQVTIELRDGGVVGQGPCNTFGGRYTLDGTAIAIGPLESTRMSCPDLELEKELLGDLELARSYAIDAGDLVLFDEQGAAIRAFSDRRGDD
jgi:heat shock protein HslJ